MRSRQHGTTVIETLGALAVGSMMLVGLSSMIDTSMEDLKGQQAAHYQAQVVSAAQAYTKANYTPLKDAAYQPDVIVEVSIDTLKAGNYLPEGFAARNAYDQATCMLVRQPVAGSGKLDALVVTTGGQAIGDKDIAAVASKAGQGSGYITAAAPAIARGLSWSLPTDAYRGKACTNGGVPVLTGTAADGGHLVSNLFYDGPGQVSTDFLYRHEVPGQPDLNKMHTSIRFAGDAIANEGAECGSHAAVSFNSAREMLKCESNGKWSRVTTWKSPVATYGALPASDKAGDVRMVLDKKRAFVYDGTSQWIALAVDQNGDMAVERDVNAARDVKAGRNVNASNEVYATYLKASSWVMGEYFWPTQTQSSGVECNIPLYLPDGLFYLWPVGSIVRDSRGVAMSCLEYSYTDSNGNSAQMYVFGYENGTGQP